jgi:hypothetical protein
MYLRSFVQGLFEINVWGGFVLKFKPQFCPNAQ